MMTVYTAQSLRLIRVQPSAIRACVLAVAISMAVFAGGPARAASSVDAVDPAKQVVGKLAVSKIDFKRGENGAGRLILGFAGDGAAPDLRTLGSRVVVDIGNASLPASLQKPINVIDFATPVQRIDARPYGGGTQVVLNINGGYESLAYQTGNEYVVEIAPKAAAPTAGVVTSATLASAARAVDAKKYSGRPVTFNFQDVPVRTVLQLIAEESNLNIIASDTVQGNVTLRLVNVPWDQALDIVLRAKGLDKRRDGSVVWVAPQLELAKFEQDKEDARIAMDEREDLVTEYVQINYHSAAAIYKALTESKGISGSSGGGNGRSDTGFLSSRGRLVADERTNTLMISDIPKKIAQMRELINVIDRPVDQVLIESRIVVATDTFARDLGASFGVKDSRGDHTIGGSFSGASSSAVPTTSIGYTLLRGNFDLNAKLTAMQKEGRGEIVSNPRIVTSNQMKGVIRQGKQVGYVTYSTSTSGVSTPTVQFKDVELKLDVTPTITNDGRVSLAVNLNKDDVDSYMEVEGYGKVPIINTRAINTQVLVEDGQTVVIGGIYDFTDQNSVNKVPFLGDIPFLGNLFKSRSKSKEKAELLVFITPKVMQVAKR